ncbi:MAG: DUF3471 domain-containing protein [Acidobacteriaceae bacterium]|nr:DUF3471 domain-containing protein [Acidobacteriaceae bacterium]
MLTAVLAAAFLVSAQEPATITQAELVRRTQVLYDAVASGDKAPWQRCLAADVIVHDEKGGSYTKPTFLVTVEPLPAGYSGSIRVTHPQTIFAPGVAIFSYDLDEVETVFGNRMTARYHQTDTWLYRDNFWQIAASQAMRYYEDPARGAIRPGALSDYVGTYELAPEHQMTVFERDGKLFAKRGKADPVELIPESPDMFFRAGVEGRRLFHRNAEGKVDWMIDRRNNEDMLWKKVG